uniref:Profilin n=1 Tax=Meloidogyne hapla TaxID=6305 RepID=A0A1I8BL49_MELHA
MIALNIGTGHVSKAAICGLDGSIWGKSDNFKIDQAEANAAANGLKSKKMANGFFIYRTDKGSYFLIRITYVDQFLAFIIGVYESGVQPEMCSKTTGALADYFRSINY